MHRSMQTTDGRLVARSDTNILLNKIATTLQSIIITIGKTQQTCRQRKSIKAIYCLHYLHCAHKQTYTHSFYWYVHYFITYKATRIGSNIIVALFGCFFLLSFFCINRRLLFTSVSIADLSLSLFFSSKLCAYLLFIHISQMQRVCNFFRPLTHSEVNLNASVQCALAYETIVFSLSLFLSKFINL